MLEILQKQFNDAVLYNNTSLDFIASAHGNERLNIYRQTIFSNLARSLELTFPGVWALVGKECADGLAFAFVSDTNNLPNSGCLDDWGADFPAFLAKFPQLKSLPYLEDFATYEWLRHCAYGAAAGQTISYMDLQSIPQEQISDVRLIFIPAFFLYSSAHPINSIQEIIDNPDRDGALLQAPAFGVVTRVNNQIYTYWLKYEEFLFLQALQNGSTLGQADEIAQRQSPGFELAQTIALLLGERLIHQIIL